MDQRDTYISWLKSEFAASNAIIDALIQHLRVTNYENAEYDNVYKCIEQRRMNWRPVIHMQQYCSIVDVLTALQNAAFRKQDRRWDQRVDSKPGVSGKYKNSGSSMFRRSWSGNSSRKDKNDSNTASTSESSCSMEGGKILLNCNLRSREIMKEAESAKPDTCFTVTDCSTKDEGNLSCDDCTKLKGDHALQTKGSNTASISECCCNLNGRGNSHNCSLKTGKISHITDLAKLDTANVTENDCNTKDKDNSFGADCTKADGIHALQSKESNAASVSENCYNSKGGENSNDCNLTNGAVSHEVDGDFANTDTVRVIEMGGDIKDEENLFGADCTKIDNVHALQSRGNSNDILHAILPQIKENAKTQSEDGEIVASPIVFLANQMFGGKQVNVVDGLKQYAQLFGSSDVKKIISLSRDLRASGRKGQLKGRTFLSFERPMRGHGREMVQLGCAVAGHLEAKNLFGSQRECRAELIPTLVEDIFERLLQLKILTIKPDFCIIDFFSEGEYTHPYVWPTWYGRPVCNLFLTECDMAFSTNDDMHRPHQGTLKMNFASGDVVVMEGKSRDMVKRSVPPSPKQRILLTFGKSEQKKPPSAAESQTPNSRPHRPNDHHSGQTKHVASPHHPQPQLPMLVPLAMAYPPPIPIVACPLTQPWAPVPGTGVFLPSSSGKDDDSLHKANDA